MEQNEENIRKQKLEKIKSLGIEPYPAKFDKKQTLAKCQRSQTGEKVKTAGRLMMIRDMGKLCFAHLMDDSGKMQIALKQDDLGKEEYKNLLKVLDLGDFLGVEGEIFTTKKGEITMLVKKWKFLGKALKPLPEKWHGVKDSEIKYRQRYLDLLANEETRERFKFRSRFIKTLREFYWQENFMEVETPTLLHSATGAHARPYVTHNKSLDIDLYLRISHELPLKELIIGGYEKIFEIGKAFRNEGIDPSHLPEHTHLEHYSAYWDFEDNIKFTEKMFEYLFEKLNIPKKLKVVGKDGKKREVDFSLPWKRIDYIEMLKNDCGLDVSEYEKAEDLVKDLKKKNIIIEDMASMGLSTLIDNLYKKVSRPKIVNPV